MPTSDPQIDAGAVHATTLWRHAARQQPPKPTTCFRLFSIIVQVIVMCVLTSVFFLCVGLASILLVHLFMGGRQLRRRGRRRARRSNPNTAFSLQDLSQLAEFQYSGANSGANYDTESDRECVICLERFGDGDWYRILRECGHVFHSKCIDAWLVRAAVCPTCREGVRRKAAGGDTSADRSKELKMIAL